MMMSKKIVLIAFMLLGLGIQNTYCQTYQFKTSGLSVLEKKQNGKWGDWSELELANILIKLDTDKNRILIYSEAIQVFEIVEYVPFVEGQTDDIHSFVCLNNLGDQCTLSIIIRKNQDNRKQLYINYDNQIIVYNISNY